jgi:hypothetical protein
MSTGTTWQLKASDKRVGVYECCPFIWPYNGRPGEVVRGVPEVSFREVWNILASLVVRRRLLRQASG